MSVELNLLEKMSNKYGSNPDFVLAGGGNTSYKSDDVLYIKGSGTSLATIKADDFVRIDRKELAKMWTKNYSADEATREKEVLADMMAARVKGEERRPSVETLLHDLFPQKYVLHVHPALINGMTCGIDGKIIAKALFPDMVWADASRPGYVLAAYCKQLLDAHKAEFGKDATLLFLQNHGVFFAGNTVEEIDAVAENVMSTLAGFVNNTIENVIKTTVGTQFVDFTDDALAKEFVIDLNSPTPDHIVYCKANYLVEEADVAPYSLKKDIEAFTAKNGYAPRVIILRGKGAYIVGADEKQMKTVKVVFEDHCKVQHYSKYFGGYLGMTDDLVNFIVNWEVESYRAKQNK